MLNRYNHDLGDFGDATGHNLDSTAATQALSHTGDISDYDSIFSRATPSNTFATQGSSIDLTESLDVSIPADQFNPTSRTPLTNRYATPFRDLNEHMPDCDFVIDENCSNFPQQASNDPVAGQHMDGLASLRLSEEQRSALQLYCRKWEARNCFPSNLEITSLANLEGLHPTDIYKWLQSHFNSSRTYQREAQVVLPAYPSPTDHSVRQYKNQVRQDLIEYVRHKFYSTCNSGQAKKARADLNFKCTSPNCNYSTDDRDAWQRHELKWQPQEFWYCVLCQKIGKKTISSRKDKFCDHFSKSHPDVAKETYMYWRDISKVDFNAGFEIQCKFWNANGQCSYFFHSWADRTSHYLEHFRESIDNGPWNLKFSRKRWFDDDGNDSGNSNSDGRDHGPSSGWSGSNSGNNQLSYANFTSSRSSTKSKSRSHSAIVQNRLSEQLLSDSNEDEHPNRDVSLAGRSSGHDSRPNWLIDAFNSCLVKPPPDAKYLALDHSFRSDLVDSTPPISITSTGPSQQEMQEIIHLPVRFKDAIAFARQLGYQYLWIRDICEQRCSINTPRDIYEKAALTILPVQGFRHPRQGLYFACHYQDIQLVYSWANHKNSIRHIQNLGHGSFGIVDEVRMPSTRQTYARKEIQESRCERKNMRAWNLQEIEIMRKLHHPHIARFVAAYYEHERRSLNIIMTPVAECNLKDYLADPLRWPSKRDHISRWFLSLASALSYLHNTAGIRHKDIKPANILISRQNVFLSDFGISHEFPPDNSESYGAGVMMTPKYSAPEVAARNRRGRKADIYSLGCVFLEMATVMFSIELTKLQKFLCTDGDSNRSHTPYHQLLPRLNSWLMGLQQICTDAADSRLLCTCRCMITQEPYRRPSAATVYKELCDGTDNASTDPCACCRRLETRLIQEALSYANTSISIGSGFLSARHQVQPPVSMYVSEFLSNAISLRLNLSLPLLHETITLSLARFRKVYSTLTLIALGFASMKLVRLKPNCDLKNISNCGLCSDAGNNACVSQNLTVFASSRDWTVNTCTLKVLNGLLLKLNVNITALLENSLKCRAGRLHHPKGVSKDPRKRYNLLCILSPSFNADTNASKTSKAEGVPVFNISNETQKCRIQVSCRDRSVHFEDSDHGTSIQFYQPYGFFSAGSKSINSKEEKPESGITESDLSNSFDVRKTSYGNLLTSCCISNTSSEQIESLDRQEGADRVIDVSDLGTFSEKSIFAALARHTRCTCSEDHLSQQGRRYQMSERYPFNSPEGMNGSILFSETSLTDYNPTKEVQQDGFPGSICSVVGLSQKVDRYSYAP